MSPKLSRLKVEDLTTTNKLSFRQRKRKENHLILNHLFSKGTASLILVQLNAELFTNRSNVTS